MVYTIEVSRLFLNVEQLQQQHHNIERLSNKEILDRSRQTTDIGTLRCRGEFLGVPPNILRKSIYHLLGVKPFPYLEAASVLKIPNMV